MRITIYLVCGVVLAACRRDDASVARPAGYARTLRTDALGCFNLHLGSDVDSAGRAGLRRYFARFRLDSAAVPPKTAARRVFHAMPEDEPAYVATSAWYTDSLSDTITVFRGDGFTSIGMRLAPQGRDWVGHGFSSTDVGPPFSFDLGSVRALRAACVDLGIGAPAG